MALFPYVTTAEFVPRFVARYWDMMALADHQPAVVIDEDGMLKDRPGFSLDLIRDGSLDDAAYRTDRHEILMVMRGHWSVVVDDQTVTLAPGDVFAVPPGLPRRISPSMSGEASLFRVRNTDDDAGPTMAFETAAPSR